MSPTPDTGDPLSADDSLPGHTTDATFDDAFEEEYWSADPADSFDLVDEAAATEPTGGGRSLLSASAVPAIGTALSRVTGLMRVAALTAALGLTTVADVYNLANTAPNILYELVIGGVLSSTLVPLFIHANDDPEDNSASVMVTVAFVAITVLTILAVLAAPLINQLLSVSLDGEERSRQMAIGDDFLILLLPQIFFYGMMTLATAVLHAKRRFAAPAFAPVLTNIVISAAALSVLWFVDSSDGPGSMRTVYVLGLGTTAGIAAMAVAVLPAMRRSGTTIRWSFQPRHPAVRSVLRLSGWTVGFAVANQVSLLIVLTLARGVGVGAVSAYQYAFIFFQLPYGLIAVSLMTVVLPELASAAHRGDDEGFIKQFHEGLSLLLAFMLPAAGAYLFIGRPLVELLLQRGEFDAAATATTTEMLNGFAIGLPAFAVFLYCVRAFHARRNTRTPFYLNLFENALNVVLVLPLIGIYQEFGLPLAYSAAYMVAAVVAMVVLNRRVPGLITVAHLRPLVRVLAVAAAVVVWIGVLDVYTDFANAAIQVGAITLAGGTVFVIAVALCRPIGFEPVIRRLSALGRRAR